MPTTIKIWSDVRCPWCWIGHRQLGRATQALGTDLTIVYKSFLLEPDGPPQAGITVREAALSSWGLTEELWNNKRDKIIEAGAAEMLTINIDSALSVDSRDAHRLLKLATTRGVDTHEAWDALYKRHFEDNGDLGDWNTLRSIGKQIGLNDEDLTLLTETDCYATSVRDDHDNAIAHGVRSVPTVMVGADQATGNLADSVVQLVQLERAVAIR